MTGAMGPVTRGIPTVIRLLMNVICDKLKADYFLEGAAQHLAPGPPRWRWWISPQSTLWTGPHWLHSHGRHRPKCRLSRCHRWQLSIYLNKCSAISLKDNSIFHKTDGWFFDFFVVVCQNPSLFSTVILYRRAFKRSAHISFYHNSNCFMKYQSNSIPSTQAEVMVSYFLY